MTLGKPARTPKFATKKSEAESGSNGRLVWLGLVWFGLGWVGLGSVGLVWFGLAWLGLGSLVGWFLVKHSEHPFSLCKKSRLEPGATLGGRARICTSVTQARRGLPLLGASPC